MDHDGTDDLGVPLHYRTDQLDAVASYTTALVTGALGRHQVEDDTLTRLCLGPRHGVRAYRGVPPGPASLMSPSGMMSSQRAC